MLAAFFLPAAPLGGLLRESVIVRGQFWQQALRPA
jgi:hypothetical protein